MSPSSVVPHAATIGGMNIQKVTPILVVEAIEPCLPLWTKQLGEG